MTIKYTPYRCAPSPADPSGIVYRPSIKVRVAGLKDSVDLWGILDTGAVECMLPYQVLQEIDPARRSEDVSLVSGFAGMAEEVVYGAVNLTIWLKGRAHSRHAKVGFVEGRDTALWGHIGFLQYFNASFNGPGRHFTLVRKGKLPTPMSLPRSQTL
jgi:hypothetical protein